MKEHFCPVEQSTITYQGKCNWCGESDGSTNEIIEMARQAGWSGIYSSWTSPTNRTSLTVPVTMQQLVAFANLVAAKATEEANAKANASWTLMCKKMVEFEREACARVCDEVGEHPSLTPQHCAESIRARGEQA